MNNAFYLYIDNFKVYNDVNGFERGDNILLVVARIIKNCVSKYCSKDYFAGHIGGDDFVIILEGYDADNLCSAIVNEFVNKMNEFYSREDLNQGYVIAKNRHGIEEQYGSITLSIAGVTNRDIYFRDVCTLSEHATMIKKKCKEVWDNFVLIV